MLKRHCILQKFSKKGEKSGWTYLEFHPEDIELLKPKATRSFRVKGTIDIHPIEQVALLPMGDGTFIMPVNAEMRKAIGKVNGAQVELALELDKRKPELDEDLLLCLNDAPEAKAYFFSLTPSHRSYFSNWISSAKTEMTKAKRIAQTIEATSRKMGYPEMIRNNKKR